MSRFVLNLPQPRIFRLKNFLILLALGVLFPAIQVLASSFTVVLFTDSAAGSGGQGAGNVNDLRWAILQANAAGGTNTINFGCATLPATPCTILLNGPLPPITSNLTIDGGQFGDIILDGQNQYRVFFVDTGTVTLANLQIQNANARGGAGGNGVSPGGGGAGFGAGVFVNQSTAVVSIQNTYFYNCNVTGGAGGNYVASVNGGGGGGLDFAGGNGASSGGGGGGGVTGTGGSGSTVGGNGGSGGGGGGGGPTSSTQGSAGGAYANDSAGSPATSASGGGNGGNGGFGGGGGGSSGAAGGNGGYGAGGGGGITVPGAGGFGGGGAGGSTNSSGFAGGGSAAPVGGAAGGSGGAGSASGYGGGGGGLAVGSAIFVNNGSLTLRNTTGSTFSATLGQGGSGSSTGTNGSAASSPTPSSVLNNIGSNDGLEQAIAQDQGLAVGFTPTANTSISSVTVRLTTISSSQTSQVSLGLYSTTGGKPGSLVQSFTLSSPATFSGSGSAANYTYQASSNATLTGGQTYWVVLGYTGTDEFTWSANFPLIPYTTSGATFVGTFISNFFNSSPSWFADTYGGAQITPAMTVGESFSPAIFNFGGTVNGSSTTGVLATLLPGGLPATHFSLSVPQPLVVQTTGTVGVTALDPNGNLAIGYSGTAQLSSNSGSAVFPTNPITFTGGQASETGFEIGTVGTSETVTATDNVWPYITGTSSDFVISPSGPAKLVVSAPSSATGGSPFSFTVTAEDAFGNTVTTYADTVNFTSSDGSAVLPSNSTLTNGTGSFQATLHTAGNQTITATDTSNSVAGVSGAINVVPPTPVLTAQKSHIGSFTQGSTAEWTITVGNSAVSGSTSGTINVSDTLPAGYKVSNFGSTPSSWSCSGAGSQTVSCSTTSSIASGMSSPPIQVFVNVPANSPISVTNMALVWGGGDVVHTSAATAATGSDSNVPVAQVPAYITVNMALQSTQIPTAFATPLSVTVKDAGGVVVPNSSVTFTAPASGASGTFSNSAHTIVVLTNSSGVANAGTFTPSLMLGTYSVSAADSPAPSANFALTNLPGPAATLALNVPASTTTGAAFNLSVTAYDQYGNVATGYPGTVRFTSTDSAAKLPANSILTAGTGTFSAALKTNGQQKLTATDTANSALTVTSGQIAVTAPNLVVTTATDDAGASGNCTPQTTPGTGTNPTCSLRDALLYAANAGAAKISFSSAIFSTASTTKLHFGALNIPSNTSIAGPTAGTGATLTNLVTINGIIQSSVFTVNSGVSGASITRLTITGGSALQGGGIYNCGSLTVTGSSISGNSTPGGMGAGIFNSGSLTVASGTLAANTALQTTSLGGAIYNTGSLNLSDTTLSGNQAGAGGAIYMSGTATVTNTTISGNAGMAASAVGGIDNTGGALTVANSIVNGNTGTSDIIGSYTDKGGNLMNAKGGLAPLASYGGPTQTMIPLPGSAAICGGVVANASGITFDQRGFSRTTSYNSNACADSGSVQTKYTAVQFAKSTYSGNPSQPISPAPVVSVTENGQNLAAVPITLAFTGNGTATGLGPVTTAAAVGAAFSGLEVNSVGASDRLSVSIPITAAANSIQPAPLAASASLAISLVTPVVTVKSSLNPAPVGSSITLTATVTGTGLVPTGAVNFYSGATLLGQLALSAGKATLSLNSLSVGSYSITVDYLGDADNIPANSAALTQVIGKAAPTVTVSSSLNPAPVAASITFTANASGPASIPAPTGTVLFYSGSTQIGSQTLSNGQASINVSSLPGDNTVITAQYLGNGNFLAQTSAGLTQVLTKANTTLTLSASPNPVLVGATLTVTAPLATTVAGLVPTGIMVFYVDHNPGVEVTVVNGVAVFTISSLSLGTHAIGGRYGGDVNYNGVGSTNVATITVIN